VEPYRDFGSHRIARRLLKILSHVEIDQEFMSSVHRFNGTTEINHDVICRYVTMKNVGILEVLMR
jgi:hypothetical protein